MNLFEQLTSERPEPVEKNGRIVGYNWTAHGANEATDCKVYADSAVLVHMYDVSIMFGEEATNEKMFWDWAVRKYGYQYGLKRVV